MERVGHKARGFDEARKHDLLQHAQMSPEQRQRVAKALRDRVWGTRCPDVRDAIAGRRSKRR
jgi:hypothetical protein